MEGKHKAAIIGCAWSSEGQLAICAEDQSLSLSHENGQTFAELKLRLKPSHISYGRADNGKDSLVRRRARPLFRNTMVESRSRGWRYAAKLEPN